MRRKLHFDEKVSGRALATDSQHKILIIIQWVFDSENSSALNEENQRQSLDTTSLHLKVSFTLLVPIIHCTA